MENNETPSNSLISGPEDIVTNPKFLDSLIKNFDDSKIDDCVKIIGILSDILESNPDSPDARTYSSLLCAVKLRPKLFREKAVVERLSAFLQPVGAGKGGHFKKQLQKSKGAKPLPLLPALACNLLVHAFKDEDSWPVLLLKCYMQDSLGGRLWVEHESCKLLVRNLSTCWKTIDCGLQSIKKEEDAKKASGGQSESDSSKPSSTKSSPRLGPTTPMEKTLPLFDLEESLDLVRNRYQDQLAEAQAFLVQEVRKRLETLNKGPGSSFSAGPGADKGTSWQVILALADLAPLPECRGLAAAHLDRWFQSVALSGYAKILIKNLVIAIQNDDCETSERPENLAVIDALLGLKLKASQVSIYLEWISLFVSSRPALTVRILKHLVLQDMQRDPQSLRVFAVVFKQLDCESASLYLAEAFSQLVAEEPPNKFMLKHHLLRCLGSLPPRTINRVAFTRGLLKDPLVSAKDSKWQETWTLKVMDLVRGALLLTAAQAAGKGNKQSKVTGLKIETPSQHKQLLKRESSSQELLLPSTGKDVGSSDLMSVRASLVTDAFVLHRLATEWSIKVASAAAEPQTEDDQSNVEVGTKCEEIYRKLTFLSPIKENEFAEVDVVGSQFCMDIGVLDDELLRLLVQLMMPPIELSGEKILSLLEEVTLRAARGRRKDLTASDTGNSSECKEPATAGMEIVLTNPSILKQMFTLPASFEVNHKDGMNSTVLAKKEVFWQACIIAIIFSAKNPTTTGRWAWEKMPTLKCLMQMLICGEFEFLPPGALNQAEREKAVEEDVKLSDFENDLLLFPKGQPTGMMTRARQAVHDNLGAFITLEIEMPARQPPPEVLQRLQDLDASLKLGEALRRCVEPNYLAAVVAGNAGQITRESVERSASWLVKAVQNELDVTASRLQPETVCHLLLLSYLGTAQNHIPELCTLRPIFLEQVIEWVKNEKAPAEPCLQLMFQDVSQQMDRNRRDAARLALEAVICGAFPDSEEGEEPGQGPSSWLKGEHLVEAKEYSVSFVTKVPMLFRDLFMTSLVSALKIENSMPHIKFYLLALDHDSKGEYFIETICSLLSNRFLVGSAAIQRYSELHDLTLERIVSALQKATDNADQIDQNGVMNANSGKEKEHTEDDAANDHEGVAHASSSDENTTSENAAEVPEEAEYVVPFEEGNQPRLATVPKITLGAAIVLLSIQPKGEVTPQVQHLVSLLFPKEPKAVLVGQRKWNVGAGGAVFSQSTDLAGSLSAVSADAWVMLAKSSCVTASKLAAQHIPLLLLPRLLLASGLSPESVKIALTRLDKIEDENTYRDLLSPDTTALWGPARSFGNQRALATKLQGRIAAYLRLGGSSSDPSKQSFLQWLKTQGESERQGPARSSERLLSQKQKHVIEDNQVLLGKLRCNLSDILKPAKRRKNNAALTIQPRLSMEVEDSNPLVTFKAILGKLSQEKTDWNRFRELLSEMIEKDLSDDLHWALESFLDSLLSKNFSKTSLVQEMRFFLVHSWSTLDSQNEARSNQCLHTIAKWVILQSDPQFDIAMSRIIFSIEEEQSMKTEKADGLFGLDTDFFVKLNYSSRLLLVNQLILQSALMQEHYLGWILKACITSVHPLLVMQFLSGSSYCTFHQRDTPSSFKFTPEDSTKIMRILLAAVEERWIQEIEKENTQTTDMLDSTMQLERTSEASDYFSVETTFQQEWVPIILISSKQDKKNLQAVLSVILETLKWVPKAESMEVEVGAGPTEIKQEATQQGMEVDGSGTKMEVDSVTSSPAPSTVTMLESDTEGKDESTPETSYFIQAAAQYTIFKLYFIFPKEILVCCEKFREPLSQIFFRLFCSTGSKFDTIECAYDASICKALENMLYPSMTMLESSLVRFLKSIAAEHPLVFLKQVPSIVNILERDASQSCSKSQKQVSKPLLMKTPEGRYRAVKLKYWGSSYTIDLWVGLLDVLKVLPPTMVNGGPGKTVQLDRIWMLYLKLALTYYSVKENQKEEDHAFKSTVLEPLHSLILSLVDNVQDFISSKITGHKKSDTISKFFAKHNLRFGP